MKLFICEDRQRVLDAEGHVLITGGAGCGKTAIAVLKAKKRVEAGLLSGQSVLFLSFSRAAVARVIEAVKEHVPRGIQGQLGIQTFHSFFWEILRAYGYLLGAPKVLQLLLPQDELAMRNGERTEDAAWAAARERLFHNDGRVAFDLFAPKAHELLSKSHRLRDLFACRHPLVVVDEAQDTAEDQWQSIRLLAEKSQLICLADLDQQIYDFRPGVSSERVTQIMKALNPLRVDLQGQNHRSPGSEILNFGNDILLSTPRGSPYKGVSQMRFRPDREHRDKKIRSSVGMVFAKVREAIGTDPENVAVLATWGRGVAIISRALSGDDVKKSVPHRVVIDEAAVLLSSRVVAFVMEPRGNEELPDLATALQLAAAVFRSKGGASNLKQATKLTEQALEATKGRNPKARSVADKLTGVFRRLRQHQFTGEPKRDWIETRRQLKGSGAIPLAAIAEYAEQLIVFQRGQRIAAELSELWQSQGNYSGARRALDDALAQDMLLSGGNDLHGIHVMTIHKSKGKEFDAVVVFDDSNNCPLIFCKEPEPFPRCRKLLRVGITRAKHHVLVLTPAFGASPLLDGHKL